MVGELIGAIVIGIIAGYLGRLFLPGKDPLGFLGTVAAGVAGALVGWVLFTYLLGIGDEDKFDLGGIIGAVIGTMLVLLAVRALRPGPDRRDESIPPRT
ncbi:MAG: GlsB/YeaQ/YmgE family stress response membrane protein [Solirubrobacteraceae bacterium]